MLSLDSLPWNQIMLVVKKIIANDSERDIKLDGGVTNVCLNVSMRKRNIRRQFIMSLANIIAVKWLKTWCQHMRHKYANYELAGINGNLTASWTLLAHRLIATRAREKSPDSKCKFSPSRCRELPLRHKGKWWMRRMSTRERERETETWWIANNWLVVSTHFLHKLKTSD